MEEVNVEVVGREVIKPASPSPHDRLQLSVFDLKFAEYYVSAIFFYKAAPEMISENLKNSLSETLSRFYPLAGRIDGVSIKCNDEGAFFTEARTDLLLHDFLRNLNTDSLKRYCPAMAPGDFEVDELPLLSVMVTFFGSGSGVAISVSVSHIICDVASLSTFVTEWANTTAKRKTSDNIPFAETTIYPPPPPSPHDSSQSAVSPVTNKCVVNRFFFDASNIAELKLKSASESVPVPSRVEAISALVWRCAANASRSNLEVPKSTLMSHALDLRGRILSTVLPQEAIGNLQTGIFLKNGADSDLNLSETVASFRKAKEETIEMIQEHLQANTLGQYLLSIYGSFASELKPDIDFYAMTSWCRKPFYKVDFGWGSPVWFGSTPHNENTVYVLLIDSKDGEGVESWIGLPEQDMSVFLQDQDLLAYAALNPPVLI